MRYVHRQSSLASVPMGGIGTGSFEVGADGRFREWLIFNNRPWSNYGAPEWYLDPDDVVLFIRAREGDGEPLVRGLFTGFWYATVEDYTYRGCGPNVIAEPYHLPWTRGVEEIELDARPPVVTLHYNDRDLASLGLEVSLELASPLVPGDVDSSSWPVVAGRLSLKNNGRSTLKVSAMLIVRNPHRVGGAKATTRALALGEGTAIVMSGEGLPEAHGMRGGSLAFAFLANGSRANAFTVNRADRASFVNRMRRVLVDFRADGALSEPEEASSDSADVYGALTHTVELRPGEYAELPLIIAWYYPNHVDNAGRRVGHYYERLFNNVEEVLRAAAASWAKIMSRAEGISRTLYDVSYPDFVADLVAAQLTTVPKLSWLTKDGRFGLWEGGPGCCGLNTVDVALWGFTGIAALWPQLIRPFLEDVAKFVLNKDLHYYYELMALAFPENMAAYREALRRNPSIQHDAERLSRTIQEIVSKTGKDPDGRVPHSFRASFDLIDNYDRNDLMPEYLLIALLYYRTTGDSEAIKALWPTFMRVYRGTLRQHDDADVGLIYHAPPSHYRGHSRVIDEAIARGGLLPGIYANQAARALFSGPHFVMTSLNTFDEFSFIGYAAFTGDLWASAMKGLAQAARELGMGEAKELEASARRASESLVRLLWNGSYFDDWYDPVSGLRDRAVLSAQLTGEWYLRLIGLELAVDENKVRSALRAVYENNFRRWEGLINGLYPGSPRPSIVGDVLVPNGSGLTNEVSGQADTPWSGVEFGVASQMIYEGMVDEALALLRSVHDRYEAWGLYWNHLECDGHYMRPLAALTVPNALAGAVYDGVARSLRLDPKISRGGFRGPLLLAGSMSVLEYSESQQGATARLSGVAGSLPLKAVVLSLSRQCSKASASVAIDGRAVQANSSCDGRELRVALAEELRLSAGSVLEVRISFE